MMQRENHAWKVRHGILIGDTLALGAIILLAPE